MMQLSLAVDLLVPLHHNDAIESSCWSTGPPAYSGRCRVSSGHVLKKLRTRLDSEISGGRETKYCACVCVCVWEGGVGVCVYAREQEEVGWVRGGGRGRACKHLEWR